MSEQSDRREMKARLKEEMARWQVKIDEARVQMNLGAKDAQDRLRPYMERMEAEMAAARAKWDEVGDASGDSWEDLKAGLNLSFTAMKEAFDSAKENFREKDED